METFYIGIDVGTGSARACIIDKSGIIRGIASEDIELWVPETGHYEQSTNNIWHCICISVRRALSQNPSIPPSQIRGIGIAATCSLAVFSSTSDSVHEEAPTPIPVTGPDFQNDGNDRNVILWLDHRAAAETALINSTHSKVLRYVGDKISIEMEIPKILWLKRNMPEDLFANCKFFDLADALTYLATGNESRSFCSAVCKQTYLPAGVEEGVDEGWQKDFFRDIDLGELPRSGFGRLGGINGVSGKFLSAGELVGVLSQRAACELGLPAGIAVGSGVIDAYAGWVGTIAAKADLEDASIKIHSGDGIDVAFTRLASVAGTSTCHLAMSAEPVFVKGVWGPYRDVLIPKHWMAEGGQSATGELLKHVLETHPAFHDAVNAAGEKSIYDFLNSCLEKMSSEKKAPSISYLGRHLFFYGDLWGNRSPLADPMMTGACIGLSSDKSISGLALQYYGALEFIALQTRQIVETMNTSGHNLHSIFMSGSQCQNKILMELISTTCNMSVVIPTYETAAVVHGAAMLGVKAATGQTKDGDEEEDLWSIMSRMSQPGRVVAPVKSEGLKKLLDAKYEVFLEMYRTQQRYREDVDEAIRGWNDV